MPRFSAFRPGLWLAPASALVAAASLSAQTSGMLAPALPSYNFSTAPWLITGGAGTFPGGGGVATLGMGIAATPGTLFAGTDLTIDVSPTLSEIRFNSPFSTNLTAGAGTSIVASSSGLALNAIQSASNTPTLFLQTNTISSPISGGGASGLTKLGNGTVTLGGSVANTYTGGTYLLGGVLMVSVSAAVGDGVFGATGAGNGLFFAGGALYANVTGGLNTTRDVALGTGGATIFANTATTLGGIISGGGSLTNGGTPSLAPLTLTGVNTYTGATINSSNESNLVLSGNGRLTASSAYDLAGSITLSNVATNVTDRLSDTAPVTLRGASFTSLGNNGIFSSETIGAVTLAGGYNSILVSPGVSAGNSLTMASLTRQNNAVVAFRGAQGGTPAPTVANIYSTVAPALVGGGGAGGITTASIVPWAIGQRGSGNLDGSSFVSYGAGGFRPLIAVEYASDFGGNNLDNVRLTGGATLGGDVTANALLIQPSASGTSVSGGTIHLTSGALLFSPTTTLVGQIGSALDFGSAEGVITNTSNRLNFTGPMSGSGGVTYTAPAPNPVGQASFFLSGGSTGSTYTGNTTINGGTVQFNGTVAPAGNPSVFGSSGTIVLSAGNTFAALSASPTSAVLNRDLSSIGTGDNYVTSGGSNVTFTLNGAVQLANDLIVDGGANNAASAFTFNGNISGSGGLLLGSLTYAVFNGNNTFGGGVTLADNSTLVAGSNTAFGTGMIYLTGNGGLQGFSTVPRVLSNQVFIEGNPTFGGAAALIFTAGVTLNGGARTLTFSNSELTIFTGVVTNGAITKAGTGPVAFANPGGNTFSGGFVNTGTAATASVIFGSNSTGSAFGPGAVSIGATSASVYSTLAGNFTTSGSTTVGGRLSPGNSGLTPATGGVGSTGTISFGSDLTFSSSTTSSLFLEVTGPATADRLNVSGTLTLAGTVFLASAQGYILQAGDTFDLVDWGTLAGTATIDATGLLLAPGVTLDLSRFLVDGTITAVPEPGTVALVVFVGLAFVIRRQRR